MIAVPMGIIVDKVLDSMNSISYSSNKFGPIPMVFVMIIVYLIGHWILSLVWRRKHKEHATVYRHPVDMNLSRSKLHPSLMNYRFDFLSPGFAEKFSEMNSDHIIT